MEQKNSGWEYWRDEWVYPLLIAAVLAIIVRMFIVQPFKIPSTSMYPTLQVGDRIFVNEFLYGSKLPWSDKRLPKIRDPKRGDIIVFVSTTDPDFPEPKEDNVRILGHIYFNKVRKLPFWYSKRYLVKRLIGLPGETLEIRDGSIYINGEAVEKPLSIKSFHYFNAGEFGQEGQPVNIPEGHYFMMGDNSNNSVDSRFWGFVPMKNIVGKVFTIWWPLNRLRVFN